VAQGPQQPMAEDELLSRERALLTDVSSWYRNTDWGFYTRIVWYSYVSIRPYFHGGNCLEMGPADGEMSRFLAGDFARLSVLDASAEYVEAVRKVADNVTGHVALFEEFEPPERYDTVVMSHVLEHIHDPVLVLRRACSWLAPGGRIIAVVPNADSLHRRLGVKLGLLERRNQLNEQDLAIGHRRVYNREEFDADLTAAGLRSVAKGGIFLKLLSNNQMLGFDDEQLIDGMFELGKDLPELCSEIYSVAVPA
jgi:2-polyprenyl-3-methyl-5-hydroxy-6-metoxy-1,4-benzoquinol methylase